MAQLIVRNLEDDVREKLREMARRHGRSMEEEIRDILRKSIMGQDEQQCMLGSRIVKRFSACGLDEDIREQRSEPLEPPSFEG